MEIDQQTLKAIVGDLYLQKAALELQVSSLTEMLQASQEPTEPICSNQ